MRSLALCLAGLVAATFIAEARRRRSLRELRRRAFPEHYHG
jgi:hypothetical protein